MNIDQRIRAINEERQNTWEAGKAVLTYAERAGRDLTAEETAQFDRISSRITQLDIERETLLSSGEAQRTFETINEEARRAATSGELKVADQRDSVVREFFRRGSGVDAINIDLRNTSYMSAAARNGIGGAELRLIASDSGASGGSLTVPTTVESTVWSYFVSSNAMRRLPCTVVTRPDGAPYVVPRVNTHSIATQVATQNTAFAGTDPVLGDIVLNAYDYGELTAISNDLAEDSGVDVLSFVSQEIGGAVGRLTSTKYITGSGSSEPKGVMTAITGAGTVSTGGTLITPTYEKLIDLVYSIPNQYRMREPAFLMHDLTAASIRKLRDGAGGTSGAFIWNASPTAGMQYGQPDTLLGYRVEIDASVASLASDAKTVAFGDWSAYWIRDVVGLRLEKSQDLLFNLNQTAYRGLLRTDGNLVDTQGPAINVLHQNL